VLETVDDRQALGGLQDDGKVHIATVPVVQEVSRYKQKEQCSGRVYTHIEQQEIKKERTKLE
jgi:hypothetical protein